LYALADNFVKKSKFKELTINNKRVLEQKATPARLPEPELSPARVRPTCGQGRKRRKNQGIERNAAFISIPSLLPLLSSV